MLQIYSSTLPTDQLLMQVRRRVEDPLSQQQRRAIAAAPEPAQMPQGTPILLVRAWRAFRASGYSWRWIARQIPGVLPAYLLAHTLLGLRSSLHALERSQFNVQNALKAQQRQFDKQLHELRYQQEKLQRENTHLRKKLQTLEKRTQHLNNAAAVQPPTAREGEQLSHWYSTFEEAQRGHVSQITLRQTQYISLAAPVLQALAPAPALDLGCGRGEWVQLLTGLGHPAIGVDSNPAMLQQAETTGAEVYCDDIFTFLADQPPAQYALVSSFQVVEHLPPAQLLQLLQHAWRVLRPGGMVILETPNPENLQVAAYSFWMDPTHQRPLPPPLLLHMAQHVGFVECHIQRSSPWPSDQQAPDLPQPLPKLLYAEQDYALIARKPAL